MDLELLQEIISKIARYNAIFWLLILVLLIVLKKTKILNTIFMYYYPLSMLIGVFQRNLQSENPHLFFIIFYAVQLCIYFISYLGHFLTKNKIAIIHYCIPYMLNILFMFASLYSILEVHTPNSFSNISSDSLTRSIDFLYFSITLFAAGGLGDIVPLTLQAKLLVMLEIVLSFSMIVLVVIFAREKKETVKKPTLPKRGDWLRYRR